VTDKDLANRAISNAAATAAATSVLVTVHFKIDYTGTPVSYAKSVAAALETSWSSEIDSQGFNAPQSPSDGLIDVFLVQQPGLCILGFGCDIDGIAIPGSLSLLVGGDGDPAIRFKTGMAPNVVQATAAHEFFHLVQYEMAGFLNMSASWFREGMASAMEDVVFPSANDYIAYANDFFDHFTDHDLQQLDYNAALFHKLIVLHLGGGQTDFLKLWLVATAIQQDPIASLYQTLNTYGTGRDEIFHDFSLWNLFSGARTQSGYYDDAGLYHGITNFHAQHTMGAVKSVPATDITLTAWSSQYIQITPDSTITSPRKLTIKVHGDSTGHIRGWVVIRSAGGAYTIKDLNFSSAGPNAAVITINDFSFSNTSEVVLVLSNGFEGDELTGDYSVELPTSLDLAFCMDTTGSMSGSINALKSTATQAMQTLGSNGADFRIAITEFKDWPCCGGSPGDYPYRADSPFSNQPSLILGGINMLFASGGGDWPESQYSGIMGAINAVNIGAWRSGAKKAIVVMTDAPPKDPEPVTGYTAASVAAAAQAGGIVVNNALPPAGLATASARSPKSIMWRATGSDANPIRIYGVAIGPDSSAYAALAQLAAATGGQVFRASYNSSDISAALLAAIGAVSGGGTPPPPPSNRPPDVSGAFAEPSQLWPPDNKMTNIHISNVTDPDGDSVSIVVTGITQDETVSDDGNGHNADGSGIGTPTAQVRATRDGNGNGRVYRISFRATDARGASSTGSVTVCVPHDQGGNETCDDDGQIYDSTNP